MKPIQAAARWDSRPFAGKPKPFSDTTLRAPSLVFGLDEHEQEEQRVSPGVAGVAAPARQHLWSPPRLTVRPPRRSSNGKFTLRQCSPSPFLPEFHNTSATGRATTSTAAAAAAASTAEISASNFDLPTSSNCYGHGVQDIIFSASDSDASMDAEVASLTCGRRLGNGTEGLTRVVRAPCRPRAGEPRFRDGESAVALLDLHSPSTRAPASPSPAAQQHHAEEQEQEHEQERRISESRLTWSAEVAAGDHLGGARWWWEEPALKRQRR